MTNTVVFNAVQEESLKIKKYAAIDIGSNAMRLLITYIVEQEGKEPQFNKRFYREGFVAT